MNDSLVLNLSVKLVAWIYKNVEEQIQENVDKCWSHLKRMLQCSSDIFLESGNKALRNRPISRYFILWTDEQNDVILKIGQEPTCLSFLNLLHVDDAGVLTLG